MPDSRPANQTTAEATTVSLPPVASLLDDHTPPDAVSVGGTAAAAAAEDAALGEPELEEVFLHYYEDGEAEK